MDDLGGYYNTLGDVMNSNLTAKAQAEASVNEKHEQLKELLVGLGEPLLDDSMVEGFKYVRQKAWNTAKRAGKAGADKLLNQYGLSSDDLENYVNEARKGNFSSPRLEDLWNTQKNKVENILAKVQGKTYRPVGNVLPEGNILPSQRVDKPDKSIKLDGEEEINRMSQEDEGASNLIKYRKAYLKKQYQKLTPEEKGNVEQAVSDARQRGDYVSSRNTNLDNAEKAKNLKVRRDAINNELDNRDIPLISHTDRPTELTVKGDNSISVETPKLQAVPKNENYLKPLSEIEQDNRVVNFNTLRQDIQSGRGGSATRIANKNVNLQKQEFFDNASLEQRNAFNEAENIAHTNIDLLGKTAPETAQAKLEATQNLVHQSVLGENELNGSKIVNGLEGKVGEMSDALKNAGEDISNTVGEVKSGVKKGVEGAFKRAGEVMAETDIADTGTEGDPIGDVVGLLAGAGALIGGLYHKKQEAPSVIPLSTSIQLGAGNL
jgi:hypothetical protein